MSTMSDALASALSALASIKGESLSYCATVGGTYLAMTGWCLHKDRVQPFMEAEREIELQAQTATLKGPLAPAMTVGLFVKDSSVSPARIYVIEAVKSEAQQVCGCKRTTAGTATPNRHGAS